jgi:hypothetical protein
MRIAHKSVLDPYMFSQFCSSIFSESSLVLLGIGVQISLAELPENALYGYENLFRIRLPGYAVCFV